MAKFADHSLFELKKVKRKNIQIKHIWTNLKKKFENKLNHSESQSIRRTLKLHKTFEISTKNAKYARKIRFNIESCQI